jgi:hypothetical protein
MVWQSERSEAGGGGSKFFYTGAGQSPIASDCPAIRMRRNSQEKIPGNQLVDWRRE